MTVPNRPRFDRAALDRMPVRAGSEGEVELTDYPRKMVRFQPREHGAVTLWMRPETLRQCQEPDTGRRYIIGACWRPGWSVALVLDQKYCDQVALFRQQCTPAEFAERVALLGRLYNLAFLIPEVNNAELGDALIGTQYPMERIFSSRQAIGSGPLMGFETTAATRPRLVTALDESIRGIAHPILIKSSLVIEECRAFVAKPDGTLGPEEGFHDGCVWAAALAALGLQFAPKPEPYVRKIKGGFVDPRGAAMRKKRPDYDD
jgi:hypothetical protein